MTTLSSATAKTILSRLGFRVNNSSRYNQALRDFQAGWNLGAPLEIDGDLGPKTSAALLQSEKRRSNGLPTASAHFSFEEFQCHCGGRYSACRRVNGEGRPGHGQYVLRGLIQRLERIREEFYDNSRLGIISGYRCAGRNREVKGASSSQHMLGAAADIHPVADKDDLRKKKLVSGIGFQGSNDKVRHVDIRHNSGVNPTKSTVANPAVWKYS